MKINNLIFARDVDLSLAKDEMRDKKITIVGCGLMGGSLLKFFLHHGFKNVSVIERDEEVHSQVLTELGFFLLREEYTSEVLSTSDLVILCLYPSSVIKFLEKYASSLKEGCVVTDIGGIKNKLVNVCFDMCEQNGAQFVGAHPMAGKEKAGFTYSVSDLFRGCSYIITPHEQNTNEALKAVQSLAFTLGAEDVNYTTPEIHDKMIAYTSQLPHVIAMGYMESSDGRDVESFAANSFRDVTRVTMMNDIMWSELFIDNKAALSKELTRLCEEINTIKELVESEDTKNLKDYMIRNAKRREKIRL